jgi:hypothetical protein
MTPGSWYVPRNCIFLLSRLGLPDEATRRKAIAAIGPYVTSDLPKLRATALTALKFIGGRETIPHVVRALDPDAYFIPEDEAGIEALKHHAIQAIGALASTDIDAGLTVVAEVAIGTRATGFSFYKELRDDALAALEQRTAPLPRRTALILANYLKEQSGRRIKFVVGNIGLGIDVKLCKALVRILARSEEPEVREILATPFARKLAARGTQELSGHAIL